MTNQISEKLKNTLNIIRRLTHIKGMPPTMKEITDELRIKPPSVFVQLKRLEMAGYIERTRNLSRSIRIIQDIQGLSPNIRKMVQIPIVGRVAAGSPILAKENIEGYIPVEKEWAERKGCLFGLKVKGDSMIGAHIKSGDCVIVRQQPLAENGDIVVALIDDEGVVKKLYMKDDNIELISENSKYKPIRIEHGNEFRIVCKVMAICHLREEKV
jgi:repressor LexA